MIVRGLRAALACRRGVSAVETGLVLPLFLGLLFGIVDFSLVAWTQASLHVAVENAARCASVNSSVCGSASAIEAYALAQYSGQPLRGTNPFTYSASGCGHTVSVNYTYNMSVPFYGTYPIPLTATACFP